MRWVFSGSSFRRRGGEEIADVEADEHEVAVLIIGALARVDLAVGIAPGVDQALVVAWLLVALVEQPAADEHAPARRALLEDVDRLEHGTREDARGPWLSRPRS